MCLPITLDIPANSYDVRSIVYQKLPKDSHLDDISQPIPDGTHIFGSNLPPSSLNCFVCNFETKWCLLLSRMQWIRSCPLW